MDISARKQTSPDKLTNKLYFHSLSSILSASGNRTGIETFGRVSFPEQMDRLRLYLFSVLYVTNLTEGGNGVGLFFSVQSAG